MAGPDLREGLAARVERALNAPHDQIEPFFQEASKEVLTAFASNPNLQERDLLRLLGRRDLPQEAIREIAKRPEASSNYTVQLALTRHPKTPRLVSLPLLKFLYLFDLVRLCQTPAVPGHIKVVAEEIILRKAEAIPLGEKTNLARRGPGRVAAELLLTEERDVIRAALQNPYLSEAQVLRVLSFEKLSPVVVQAIAHQEKWSQSYNVRLALIRNPLTPLTCVLAFLPDIAVNDLQTICLDRRMPGLVRKYIQGHCVERLGKQSPDSPARNGSAE